MRVFSFILLFLVASSLFSAVVPQRDEDAVEGVGITNYRGNLVRYDANDSSKDFLGWVLNANSYFDTSMLKLITVICSFCAIFTMVFLLMRIAYGAFVEVFINRSAMFFDYKSLIPGVILCGMLALYIPLSSGINEIFRLSTSAFAQLEQKEDDLHIKNLFLKHLAMHKDDLELTRVEYAEIVSKASTNPEQNMQVLDAVLTAKRNQEGMSSVLLSPVSWFKKILYQLKTLPERLIARSFMMIGELVKIVILMLLCALDFILWCIGPLAITMSILPMFKDKWKEWLNTWLVMKGALITYILLDQVILALESSKGLSTYYSRFEDFDQNNVMAIGLHFSFGIMHIMVIWLTKIWIGGDGNDMMDYYRQGRAFARASGLNNAVSGTASYGKNLVGRLTKKGTSGGSSVLDSLTGSKVK